MSTLQDRKNNYIVGSCRDRPNIGEMGKENKISLMACEGVKQGEGGENEEDGHAD